MKKTFLVLIILIIILIIAFPPHKFVKSIIPSEGYYSKCHGLYIQTYTRSIFDANVGHSEEIGGVCFGKVDIFWQDLQKISN